MYPSNLPTDAGPWLTSMRQPKRQHLIKVDDHKLSAALQTCALLLHSYPKLPFFVKWFFLWCQFCRSETLMNIANQKPNSKPTNSKYPPGRNEKTSNQPNAISPRAMVQQWKKGRKIITNEFCNYKAPSEAFIHQILEIQNIWAINRNTHPWPWSAVLAGRGPPQKCKLSNCAS